jgi:hypothetical protein
MDWGNVRLENLVKYLQSVQVTKSSALSSGAELYQRHCAVFCHGNDLKGTGPTPEPIRSPPDLTILARRHGGEFPDSYVSNVLQNGVTLPAYGPAEIPVWGEEFRATETESAARRNLIMFIKSRQIT